MVRRAKLKKPWTIAVLAVLLAVAVMASVNVTYAYLFTKTNSAENNFVPAVVDCEMDEDFIDNVKSDVRVKNIGTTEAYMRLVVVVTWQDDNGNCLAMKPQENVDFTMKANTDGWFKHDGIWYCKTPVAVGFNTPPLIEEFKPTGTNTPNGYHLTIQFLASAIQSQPDQAVEEAWGIQIVDGQLVPPSNNQLVPPSNN